MSNDVTVFQTPDADRVLIKASHKYHVVEVETYVSSDIMQAGADAVSNHVTTRREAAVAIAKQLAEDLPNATPDQYQQRRGGGGGGGYKGGGGSGGGKETVGEADLKQVAHDLLVAKNVAPSPGLIENVIKKYASFPKDDGTTYTPRPEKVWAPGKEKWAWKTKQKIIEAIQEAEQGAPAQPLVSPTPPAPAQDELPF